jgi:hypothetical protein
MKQILSLKIKYRMDVDRPTMRLINKELRSISGAKKLQLTVLAASLGINRILQLVGFNTSRKGIK